MKPGSTFHRRPRAEPGLLGPIPGRDSDVASVEAVAVGGIGSPAPAAPRAIAYPQRAQLRVTGDVSSRSLGKQAGRSRPRCRPGVDRMFSGLLSWRVTVARALRSSAVNASVRFLLDAFSAKRRAKKRADVT